MRKGPVLLRSLLLPALLGALAACASTGGERGAQRLIYSPNGEPLSGGTLGHPDCETTMTRWLARVDLDHDGTVELGEFLADARRQFAAMDLDHDGIITPAELQAYRAPFLDEGRRRGAGEAAAGERPRRSRREEGSPDGGSDRPDPVMSADLALRNQVSEADFLAQAERRFRVLDGNHDGRLDKYELVRACSTSG